MEKKVVCFYVKKALQDSKQIENELKSVGYSTRFDEDLNQCLDFLLHIGQSSIIFVVSNAIAENILPFIHSFQQIHSIFILIDHPSSSKQFQSHFEKIKRFNQNIQSIIYNIKQIENKLMKISYLSSNKNRQDPLFMYSQLLKDILLNDHRDENEQQTKIDMLNYCREIYCQSVDTLSLLDDFEKNYLPELSIYWYTRECFLYQMLNKALWTPQPDVLYKLRYFLRHLHQQIVSQSVLQENNRRSFVVYRGQNMSEDEVDKFKENLGGFLSFNNFLSTSLNERIARHFLPGLYLQVLFEMHIDEKIVKYPFANIEHLSYQQGKNNEGEILFSMGTVFRIIQIRKESNFYRVRLSLSQDIDEELDHYTKSNRELTHSTHSFLSLLKLMEQVSQFHTIHQIQRKNQK